MTDLAEIFRLTFADSSYGVAVELLTINATSQVGIEVRIGSDGQTVYITVAEALRLGEALVGLAKRVEG